MKITKITIVLGSGPDTLLMETDLPQSMWPHDGNFGIKGECAAGSGISYVKEHFPGIEPTIVDVPRMYPKFSK